MPLGLGDGSESEIIMIEGNFNIDDLAEGFELDDQAGTIY